MKRTSPLDYDYTLPPDLIASHPLPNREASRMLVVHRASRHIEHRSFSEFPQFLSPNEIVVLNNSRVIRARTHSIDGSIEVFFLEQHAPDEWLCLVRPGRKMRIGNRCSLQGATLEVIQVLPSGERIVRVEGKLDLECIGDIPLPPYIKRSTEATDTERYQTVFAKEPGSVAAPTAGLHFTNSILAKIPHTFITLHVGTGTFRPIETDDITQHTLHTEHYEISSEAANAINKANTILAVGTTVTRVLETQPLGPIQPLVGRTNLFVYPPFTFNHVHKLLTNFHLPRSSLLMLVTAFGGYDLIMHAYQEAIREKYRFYSYGDCMLIL